MATTCQGNAYKSYSAHPSARGKGSSGHVVLYPYTTEAAPLLHGERESRGITIGQLMALILFSFMAYHTSTHLFRWPLDPPVRHGQEERLRLNLHWGDVDTHTCTTYATRGYSAQLLNLPTSWYDRVDACMATPLGIHGISYFPKYCDDKGPGVVIGRWEIDQQEPDCTTYWDEYNDKGCTSPGSGKRHYTHKLMNLPEGSDWREFCATTPISFKNMHFPGAEECFTSIWGVYGRWELDDSRC